MKYELRLQVDAASPEEASDVFEVLMLKILKDWEEGYSLNRELVIKLSEYNLSRSDFYEVQ